MQSGVRPAVHRKGGASDEGCGASIRIGKQRRFWLLGEVGESGKLEGERFGATEPGGYAAWPK